MAKTKKTSQKEHQRLATANHKKEYLKQMKHIINSYSDIDVFALIPTIMLDVFYKSRMYSMKFEKPIDEEVDNNMYRFFNSKIVPCINNISLQMGAKGNQSIIGGYQNTILWAQFFKAMYGEKRTEIFSGSNEVLKAVNLFFEDETFRNEYEKKINDVILTSSLYFSDMRTSIFWIGKQEIISDNNVNSRYHVILHTTKCPKISLEIDGGRRPAYQMGWPLTEIGWDWIKINPEVFQIKHPDPDFRMKVYVQSHAIERLHERTTGSGIGIVQYDFFISLLNPIVVPNHQNGGFLIEYKHMQQKVGYFVASIIDDFVLIRTFLFITSSGTPEGDILGKLTGLKKLDKKYLSIDKLSTFMNSDLVENPEIRKTLMESNCESVIKIYDILKFQKTDDNPQFSAEKMLKYLMLAHESE